MPVAKQTNVGTSSRTPFKHWVLNSELGRICGVLSTGKVHARACPFHVIDLCAGDGHASSDSEQSSPEIITRHCRWLEKRGLRSKATLIERGAITFAELMRNTQPETWLERLNMDAREYRLNRTSKHQAMFIHADPNSIADWPITQQLLESLSETTTMLATLGCNVGGLKRLKREDRLPWFNHVQSCIEAMPKYHDALLIELANDKSQWAYLLRLPARWTAETAVKLRTVGRKYTTFDLNLASVRINPTEFMAMENKLFLTKEERGEK